MSERVVTDRAERRAIFDAFFARAKGFGSRRGLADYIQERRREQHFPVMRGETYTGCSCREALCIWQYAIAWMDELVASYEVKVQEFAAETRRRRPAAAVPEAQDGRCSCGPANKIMGTHGPHCRPAAVREGERERALAAVLDVCRIAEQRPEQDQWVSPITIRAVIAEAAPSLAAPEGTEQP
jgi:hypothetical protein